MSIITSCVSFADWWGSNNFDIGLLLLVASWYWLPAFRYKCHLTHALGLWSSGGYETC